MKNSKQIFNNLKVKIKNFLPITNYKLPISTQRYPFDIEIVLLLIISWIAIAMAGFSNAALGIWKAYFFEPILVYLLIFNVWGREVNDANGVSTMRIAKKILWPLALSVLAVSLIAILQKFGWIPSPANFWPRLTGAFTYPNALGLYVGPVVPLLSGWFLFSAADVKEISNSKHQIPNKYKIQNTKYKIIFIIAVLFLSLLSLFLSRSEGALIGVIVAFGVMFLFWSANKFQKKLFYYFNYFIISLILLFVLVSTGFFLQVVPEHKYFDFDSSVLNYVSDKVMLKDFSGEVRKQQWRETWQFLTASPRNFILGAGLSAYQQAVEPYHQPGIFFNQERDPRFYNELVWGPDEYKWQHWRPVEIYMYPHNLLLNFWLELGLPGVVLFVWIIGKYLVFSIKSYYAKTSQDKYLALGLLGAMIVLVVHGLVDVPYFKNDLAVIFWVLVALLGFQLRFSLEKENKHLIK